MMPMEKKQTQQGSPILLFSPKQKENEGGFRPVALVDQIAKHLRDKILTGILKGGEQLFEDALKNEFEVSRTPLREAFRVLEKEGLVEILPRKGTFVRKITRKDIEENFPVRATLEGLAARFAYENLTQVDIDEMEEAFSLMEKAAQEKDFIEYARYHLYLHEIFINASENEILITLLHNLRMHTLWHRYTYQYYKEDFRNSLKVHRKIINLFRGENTSPEEIERVVRQHIEVALVPFLTAMEKLEGGT